MVELKANSGDPDQTQRSDLGLHCVPVTRLVASSIQWVTYSWVKTMHDVVCHITVTF